jgi:purine-binding chemotaxis protein CheW
VNAPAPRAPGAAGALGIAGPAASAGSAHAWCTFKLAGGDYGVELSRVQEVLRPQPVTRLPLAPPAIAGLINLRGRIVPVVDPRRVLGGEAGPPSGFVVVSAADGPVALLVDAIGDVRRADPASPPPSLPAAIGRGESDDAPLIARTLALPDQTLVVLDLDRVLERAFTTPEASPRPRPRSEGTRS